MSNSDRIKLSKYERLRYDRQLWVQGFGLTGQKALKSANVAVVGMGGLGCPAATYLASSGIGCLTLIDPDLIELSNLPRQPLYKESEQGQSKVAVAKQRLLEINPALEIKTIATAVTNETASLLLNQVDAVLDCSDNFECRYAVNAQAVARRQLLITAGVVATRGLLFVYDGRQTAFGDKTGKGDQLREYNIKPPCYACLFPKLDFIDSESLNCNVMGVLPPIAGLMGAYQALELMQYLSGKVNDRSRLLTFDAVKADWQRIDLAGREGWCDLHVGEVPQQCTSLS